MSAQTEFSPAVELHFPLPTNASLWLKGAWQEAMHRDPVDAAHDADSIVHLLIMRQDNLQEADELIRDVITDQTSSYWLRTWLIKAIMRTQEVELAIQDASWLFDKLHTNVKVRAASSMRQLDQNTEK